MRILPLAPDRVEEAADRWSMDEVLPGRLRWHLHTPYAHVRCAQKSEGIVGLIAGLHFGDHARITLLRAHTDVARGALVLAWMEERRAEGCVSFTVTVPRHDVEAWAALGFAAHEPLLRYEGGRFFEATRNEVLWMEPPHRFGVLHLDRKASGMDRRQLLQEHEYLGRVYMEGSVVRGFALALLGHALIVADTPAIGLELQRWIFPVQDHLLLPEGNTAHAHLTERGYRAEAIGVRMVHGDAPAPRVEACFAEPFGPA